MRSWSGNNPEKIVICKSSPSLGKCDFHGNVPQQIVEGLYAENKQSVIVEGGAKTIRSFIEAGIWDEIRIETSQIAVKCGTKAPMLPDDTKMLRRESYDGNIIEYFERIHY